jgi:hypothetical protein
MMSMPAGVKSVFVNDSATIRSSEDTEMISQRLAKKRSNPFPRQTNLFGDSIVSTPMICFVRPPCSYSTVSSKRPFRSGP